MSFGEWLQRSIWKVQAFFGDKDAAIHVESLDAVNSQKTEVDRIIYQTVEQEKIKHTGLLGVMDAVGDTVRGFTKGVTNILGFSLKNIQWIILLIVVGYFGWLFVNIKKGAKN